MILVGGTYTNNLVFLMAFILISFLLVAILLTARNVRGLSVTDLYVEPGFPGELSALHLTLTSAGQHPRTRVRISLDRKSAGAEVPWLEAGDSLRVTLPFPLPNRRGRHCLDGLRVSTANPFGLFHCWTWWRRSYDYFVYPKPEGEPLPTRQGRDQAAEFSGFKTFETHDSPRRISWKHYARTDELLVKVFNDAESDDTEIQWAATTQSDDEARLSQIAKWLLQAEESGKDRYRMRMPDAVTGLSRGPNHLESCLLRLAQWEVQ